MNWETQYLYSKGEIVRVPRRLHLRPRHRLHHHPRRRPRVPTTRTTTAIRLPTSPTRIAIRRATRPTPHPMTQTRRNRAHFRYVGTGLTTTATARPTPQVIRDVHRPRIPVKRMRQCLRSVQMVPTTTGTRSQIAPTPDVTPISMREMQHRITRA